jgi:hypothetical protein
MQCVVILSVSNKPMLSVIMLNVGMLSVMAPSLGPVLQKRFTVVILPQFQSSIVLTVCHFQSSLIFASKSRSLPIEWSQGWAEAFFSNTRLGRK